MYWEKTERKVEADLVTLSTMIGGSLKGWARLHMVWNMVERILEIVFESQRCQSA